MTPREAQTGHTEAPAPITTRTAVRRTSSTRVHRRPSPVEVDTSADLRPILPTVGLWQAPGGTFQNRSAANRLLLSERLEAELLAANTRFEHEAPLTGGEDRHAVLVFGVRRRTLGRGHRACLSRQR